MDDGGRETGRLSATIRAFHSSMSLLPSPLDALPDFRGLDLVVVGDLVADRYVYARPSRPSREAPLVVLCEEGEELLPGGAANTARNVRALGARVRLVGCLGRDDAGRALLGLLGAEGIGLDGVAAIDGWKTPVKTRVMAGERSRTQQQVLRLDREPEGPADADRRRALCDVLVGLAGQVDAVIVSDYGYGMVDAVLADALERFRVRSEELGRPATPIVVDPRHGGQRFRGVAAMTPNLEDLARFGGTRLDQLGSRAAIATVARRALEEADLEHLLVTLGKGGMTLFGRHGAPEGLTLPAFGSQAVVDVTGAGDTATALFTLGLAAGLGAPHAMLLANAAAGVVVMKLGAGVCSPAELGHALASLPPAVREQVQGELAAWQGAPEPVAARRGSELG